MSSRQKDCNTCGYCHKVNANGGYEEYYCSDLDETVDPLEPPCVDD